MIDQALAQIVLTTVAYGIGGSLIATIGRFINRKKPGPNLSQAAAIGFLVGITLGALIGIFRSMAVR